MSWLGAGVAGFALLLLTVSAHADESVSPTPPADSLSTKPLTLARLGFDEPRLTLITGCEVEGLRETFGFESLFHEDASGTGLVTVEGERYRERSTDILGLLGVDWHMPRARAWYTALDLEARAGESRRALTATGEAAWDSGAVRGLRVRNLLYWDDTQPGDADSGDAFRSAQNLLQVNFDPGGSRPGWNAVARGSFDLSWADTDVALSDSASATYAEYFNYRRASLGLGLVSGGLSGMELRGDVSRKWTGKDLPSAYWAFVFMGSRNVFSSRGSLDLEARFERRRYDDEASSPEDSLAGVTSALRSYDEAELYGRWIRRVAFGELEASARCTGDLYDELAPEMTAAADSLEPIHMSDAMQADRLRCEGEGLVRRELIGDRDLDSLARGDWRASPPRLIENIALAAGPLFDLVWVRGGDGDYRAAGGRVELRLRSGRELGETWLESTVDVGRRIYPGDGAALVFDIGDATFSMAQTDFTFVELSVVGGGDLPVGFTWELALFYDHEAHTRAEDDVELFSAHLALRRAWPMIR